MTTSSTSPPATAPGPVISVNDLGIEFYRSRRRRMQLREMLFHGRSGAPKETFWALRNISFDIRAGEAVGLVGGNGGGKSTLLKMIAGVLLPDEGSVTVNGGVAPLIELTGGFVGELSAIAMFGLPLGVLVGAPSVVFGLGFIVAGQIAAAVFENTNATLELVAIERGRNSF